MARRRGPNNLGRGGYGPGLIGGAFRPFKPYRPPPPPPGSYDPALDAQLGQSRRGLGDLLADTETANTRDTVDYSTRQSDLNRQIGLLHTSYGLLGNRQAQAARHQGVLSSGLLLQSAAKRTANEARDKVPLSQALQQLALDMAPPSADNPLGGRRFQDRGTALTRAQREGSQFGIDVRNQELYQASQAGYVPPGRGEPGGMPRNERISGTGVHTRTRQVGDTIYTYDENGRIVNRRRVRGSGGGRGRGRGMTAGMIGSPFFGAGASF